MTRVLMLIKTAGLAYDDRLRKESVVARQLGYDIQIIALEYANQSENRCIYGGVPASTLSLRTRSLFPRTKAVAVKAVEMYWKFLVHVLRRRPDVLWVHNMEMIGLLPAFVLLRKVGLIERLVWDQHELPSDHLLSNGVFLRVFAVLMNQCDHIVMANRQRKRLVQRLLGGSLTAEVTVLANYPDGAFANLPKDELPLEVRDWLEDDAYVLAQGGASANRHFYELVEAIRDFENLKLVVVGPYQQQQVDLIREQYGDEALERILFTDFVPQMRIAAYVDHALTSVVFYDTAGVNRKFCASNRFYQAICRGIPVTVSANPPMRNVVNRHGCGVVVDASSPVDIARGLREIVRSRGAYCQSTIGCSGDFMWENQVDALSRVLRG